jgi:hypothetical protein
MTRRVTTHNGRTLDDEELTIVTVWEENTGKQEIRKQLPYCKTYDLLVKHDNKFDFLQKNA